MELPINKIINQDCLIFMKTLPDKCIDLVLTDPPYGMEFKSNYRKVKYEKIENDNNLDWLPIFVEESYRILKDNTHAYFFCSFHNVDIFKQEIQKYFEVKNILVWAKNNTGMGDLEGDYAPQYEFIIYARKGNKKLNDGRDSNILSYNRTGNINHPTEKPLDLFSFLIRKSTSENEIVFDGFLGGGTTALACKMLKRNYIGCEISKEYCDTAEQRIKSISNTLF
jgi:site-specific DNA-methyltransferase (adenine-specific)